MRYNREVSFVRDFNSRLCFSELLRLFTDPESLDNGSGLSKQGVIDSRVKWVSGSFDLIQ